MNTKTPAQAGIWGLTGDSNFAYFLEIFWPFGVSSTT